MLNFLIKTKNTFWNIYALVRRSSITKYILALLPTQVTTTNSVLRYGLVGLLEFNVSLSQ